ncbi:MAG: hypothetical protein ACTSX8_03220 [Alphaproteobacteria bacterium]
MKLKRRKNPDEPRDPKVCAAQGCSAAFAIIVATKTFDGCDVPLCDEHWIQYGDERDAEYDAWKAQLQKVLRPQLPPSLPPGRYKFRYINDGQLEVIS